ncbi:hypothetical protein MTR67_000837 [Solanum verrucosum]|uniref:Uncharacterized protein n=1 Tax=Solanum verrucosum TaxID=315347 RepID=A0AAF0PMH6_SOLVR|nr:hypothetical protein MTR67_000837 [Solanum verrucosum]
MLPSLVYLRLYKCSLSSLELRYGGIEGAIQSKSGNITKLKHLDLSSNNLNSTIPNWLYQCKDLETLFLGSNRLEGTVSSLISNLSSIISIDFFDNMLSGKLPNVIGKLGKLGLLELSVNLFEGDIPISVTRLAGLRSFNLSKNNLIGRIPNDIGDMKVLESVDLSENQLYGQIPQKISSLTTLSYLNLSDNNLSGMIPLSTQLQSFEPTSFQGNKLCGLPLLVNCSSDGNVPNHKYEDDESDKDEVDWFYISMAIGFALSFWGVCGSLLFKRSWRHAYFRFPAYMSHVSNHVVSFCIQMNVSEDVQTMLFLS